MSGKHWLERDPSQSPGLQRIQTMRQAAKDSDAALAEIAKQEKILATEMDRKLKEGLRVAQNKFNKLSTSLQQIVDYANVQGAYPLGSVLEDTDGYCLDSTNPQVIRKAEVRFNPKDASYELRYGFSAHTTAGKPIYDSDSSHHYPLPAEMFFGMKLRLGAEEGEVLVLRRRETTKLEERRAFRSGIPLEPEETKYLQEEWIPVPTESENVKVVLTEAFHNPVYLGSEVIPSNQQNENILASIFRLISG